MFIFVEIVLHDATTRQCTTALELPELAGRLLRQPVWSISYMLVREGPESLYRNLGS